MKKLFSTLIAMAMCVSLVACGGGVDKQPAIDAFNSTNPEFAALAEEMNANIDAYSDEFVDVMIEMGESIAQVKDALEGEQELTEEQVADLVKQLEDVKGWVADVRTELENPESELYKQKEVGLDEVPLADAKEYFNSLSARFNVIAEMVQNDPSAYDDDFIAEMVTMSDTMTIYLNILSSPEIEQASREELMQIIDELWDIDVMWLQGVESELLG